jgi:hypothetical protein
VPVQPPIHHIIISDNLTVTHKLNLKEPPLSDWLALAFSNWIASVRKALDGGAVSSCLTDGARRSKKLKWETVLA